MIEQLLPADVEAERATLGALLTDRDAITVVAAQIDESAFYMEKHSLIYRAILECAMAHIPPDIRTVSDSLRRAGVLDALGGVPYLVELSVACPTAVHVEYYARIVTETATRRRLIQTGAKIAAMGYDSAMDLDEALGRASLLIEQCEHNGKAVPVYGVPAPELMARSTTPTRWIIPDLVCAGFGYVAAPPGMGKTWLLLSWAIAVATGGAVLGTFKASKGKVLFLALEDTEDSLKTRLAALLGEQPAPANLICHDEDSGWLPLDVGGLEQLEEQLKAMPDLSLIIIDTLTALSPDTPGKGNPYRADYRAWSPVRALANKYNVAIIGTWHYNKAAGQRTDPMEMVSGNMGLPAVAVNRIGIVRERDQAVGVLCSDSKRGPTQRLAIEFDSTTCQWVYKGTAADFKTSQERQAILDALDEEPKGLTPAELSRFLQKNHNTVKSLLRFMKEAGQVIGEDGRYRRADQAGDKGLARSAALNTASGLSVERTDSDHADHGGSWTKQESMIRDGWHTSAGKTPTDHADHGDSYMQPEQEHAHILHDPHDPCHATSQQNALNNDSERIMPPMIRHDPHDPVQHTQQSPSDKYNAYQPINRVRKARS